MTSNAPFREADVRRDRGGQFATKNASAPELAISEAAPVIINSPNTGDRRANLWIVVPDGQPVEMNVFEAGIGRPEEETWREDTITFRRTDEGVRAVYEVSDDDISEQFENAFAELDESEADEMKMALRNEVRVRSFGNTDAFFSDGRVEFRHVSDHDLDADGGFYTANVFTQLESDPSYVTTRDGVLFTSAYAVLNDYGFGQD
jgi:hypothetical protein